MFQFTTTNVVNSAYWNGYTPTNDQEKDKKHALFTASENESFYVKGVNNFLTENITAVYKAPSRKEDLAKIEIDLDEVEGYTDLRDKTTKKGDVFRLNIYIGLTQGSNDAMYSNDFYFKGKPLMIDFSWDKAEDSKTAVQVTAEKLMKAINRFYLNFEGEKMVDVDFDGTSKITIRAISEYQRFKKAVVEKLDPRANMGMGEWEEVDDAVTVVSEGVEGFGTYSWILHNLRIPTAARNDIFGQNVEESPIPGRTYTQYTIHYCKNRGSLGLNAVGHQATSHTTHVFYVIEDGCEDGVQTMFEEALTRALGSDLETKAFTTGVNKEGKFVEEAGFLDADGISEATAKEPSVDD